MGWSEMEAGCKKHPNHKQSKGVCPSCLRERLSHLSASSSASTTNASSSLSSPYSPNTIYCSSSSMASPSRRGRKGTMSRILKGWPEPLKKSRSLAFVIANSERGDVKEGRKVEEKKKKKGRGFWSKLWVGNKDKSRKDDKDVVLHSRTVKERSSARWVL